MPIYEYKCLDCGAKFEHMNLSASNADSKCPSCSSLNTTKLLSTFSSRTSSNDSFSCNPDRCMPHGAGGMPQCGAGGCPGMMGH